MQTRLDPMAFEVRTLVEITPAEDGTPVLRSTTKVFLNGEQVGHISRLRLDVLLDEVLPAIEIDMLKGIRLDDLPPEARERVIGQFEALRGVPGLRARMPAPRD